MKTFNRYFTRDAKSLLIQFEIRDLNRQIRKLRNKQRKLHELMSKDDAEVRQMFNDGVFTHYGNMTMQYFNKITNH